MEKEGRLVTEMGLGERRDDRVWCVEGLVMVGVYVYCVFLNDDDAQKAKEKEKAIAICVVAVMV